MATTSWITRLLIVAVATVGFAAITNPATAQPYRAPSAGVATASATKGEPGQAVNVSGSGFRPNSRATITFESTPVTLATVAADATGSVTNAVTIPADATAGDHTIKINGTDPSGQVRVLAVPFTVSAAQLPSTGADNTWRTVGIALACVAVGGVLIALVRLRRSTR